MSSKLLQYLKSGPPAPPVALLPDHRFFVRTVPVTPGGTPAQVAGEVELALEGLSPFPPAQLYHGFHWVPGSSHALVFGCYRKRFTTDQHAEWAGAMLVAPSFVAFLAVPHEPATTLVFPSLEGLTAIHWEDGAVPVRVVCAPVPAESDEAARNRIREELLRAAGPNRKVIDVPAPPVIATSADEKLFAFQAGTFAATLPVAVARTLDVRDPVELAAFRKKARNDLILWRTTAGSVAALLVVGVLYLALLTAGVRWERSLTLKYNQQRPVFQEIQAKEELAKNIESRDTQLLLPLEMISTLSALPQRGSIIFTRMVTNASGGLHVITLSCQTQNSPEVELFLAAIKSLPSVEDAKVDNNNTNRGQTTFSLSVTFKPDALKPIAAPNVVTKQT